MSDSIINNLYQQLDSCLSSDRGRLLAGLGRVRQRLKRKQPVDKELQRLLELAEKSQQQVAARAEQIPAIEYPDLPVSARREEIADAIGEHQVVIVAGETGSGKTTQLPKICLDLNLGTGRGTRGLIGHTQPRRIAARTVASRIAEELQTPLGDKVGYQVRFNDHSSDNTFIKLMTDGILLAEIQHDRYLNRYDTIIIDEAHERSLNIDFLLGYLKQILPKRPDLKIIITSATIDVERFSQHFHNAPIIEVSGRTYPVEVLYRPPQEDDNELGEQVIAALQELLELPQRGDVLVFLSGERDIRELALSLRRAVTQRLLPQLDVLPLYARLSLAEQNKVFQAGNRRGIRVVLATNVAETSVTVPGIRYVIDPGTARISRYSYRTKVQRLPIEAISQASANQRKGRCGRLSDGVCVRLYDEEDFLSRSEFTDPEIVRTNLAAVILQMLHLRIGDIRNFDFVDAPDQRLINDGFSLLKELGAIDHKEHLTAVGKQLCRLPVDPRMGRMLLAASQSDCLRELLIIASGLSIQDPRERPADKQQQADQAHARWRDKGSDFISLLNLWDHMEQQRQDLSGNQFSKYCKANFVSYLRMREWRDLHHQLHQVVRELKLPYRSAGLKNEPSDDPLAPQLYNQDAIHRALLHGLLGQVARLQEGREYLGTRNRKFMIFPGSGVFSRGGKKIPKWLMCAELLETSKLYAHTVAAIDNQWLPQLAAHLVNKSYSEPHYDSRRGEVMAFEKQTLYGLTIVERKRCRYGSIDPTVSRQIFIQGCLVEGGYSKNRRGKGRFFKHNQQLLDDLEQLEARTRRRDIVAEEQVIYDFFDQRVPDDITNLVAFEQWRKSAEQDQPRLLCMERELLMQRAVSDSSEAQFPNCIEWQGMAYPLHYHFEPGHPRDGVTVDIPLAVLHQVPKYRFEWMVPGILRDKCIALVKSLPKPQRRQFVPVPDAVDKALRDLKSDNRPLTEALAEQLKRHYGVDLDGAGWQPETLDAYYRMNFRLLDDSGESLAMARDLQQLQTEYRSEVQSTLQQTAAPSFERTGLRCWDFGELPEIYNHTRGALTVRAWPALVDEGDSVALKLLDHPQQARNRTQGGLLRLALLQQTQTAKYLHKNLFKGADLKLMAAGLPKRQELALDVVAAAYWQALFEGQSTPRNGQQFDELLTRGGGQIVTRANQLEGLLLSLLEPLGVVRKLLKKSGLAAFHAVEDIQCQLDELFADGFLQHQGEQRLQQYPRYIKALQQRLGKIASNAAKDRQYTLQLQGLLHKLDELPSQRQEWTEQQQTEVAQYRHMLQEYRVSLFAQQLRTALPVSEKRLVAQWQQVAASFA
ncbi:ATP-dependent RNA helicase HrpA [Porticoccus sp. GXU_MW_L64]